jgi:alkanesulfonate monooxygenase SsuD/methylene tetrahydromethanopterin reductase-like flavin-dependent oxidoreductase (luciferase family)
MTRIGRERGWPPTSRAHFESERRLEGALFVGSPEQIIEKILYQHELFRHDRFLIQLTVGPMPHADVLRAIELLGTQVAPAVLKATAASTRV